MNLEDELEKYENVAYRMNAEGFHYCFDSYSNFDEIEDIEFHKLRETYLKVSRNLELHVNTMISRLHKKIKIYRSC